MERASDWSQAHPGYRFLRATLGPTARFASRLQAKGAEHVPLEGAAIVACSHGSYADPVLVAAAVPRPMYFLGKQEAFRNPIVGGAFRAMGQIQVDRASGRNEDAIGAAVRLLEQGHVVGIFPEATRSRPGRVRRGKTGVARLAALTGAPVVPVGLDTGDFWPMHATLPRVGAKAYLNVGAPMRLGLAPGDAEDKEKLRAATDDVMERVKALLDEAIDAKHEGIAWS